MPWRNGSFCISGCIQEICGEYEKGHRGIATQEQKIIFLELNQEGFMKTKASYTYIFMFYTLRLMVASASAEDSNQLSFSFILKKLLFFSL